MSKIEGHIRESADGLRGRKSAEQTRKAQKEVGEAAAARRAERDAEEIAEGAVDLMGGKKHGHHRH